MKKAISSLLLLIVALCIYSTSIIKIDAASTTNISPIGNTINLPKNGVRSDKINYGNSIFNETFIESLQRKASNNKTSINQTDVVSYTTDDILKIGELVSNSLNLDQTLGVDVNDAAIGTLTHFKSASSTSNGNAVSASYTYLGYMYKKYQVYVFNDQLQPNLIMQENGYSSAFMNSILGLVNNTYDYNTFFEQYGTHIIKSAIMGGKLTIYNSSFSNTKVITNEIMSVIKSHTEASVNNLMNGSNTFKYSASNNDTLVNIISGNNLEVSAIGGNSLEFSLTKNNSSANFNYQNWVSSLNNEDKNSLILTGENGLIPIWNLLPSHINGVPINIRSIMINKYKEYVESKNSEKDYVLNSSLESGVINKTLVRSKEVRITDSGRLEQHIDELNSKTVNNLYDFQRYLAKGFRKVNITVYLEYKNVDQGYQHIYLYSHEPNKSDNYEAGKLGSLKREAASGKYRDGEFTVSNVDLNLLTGNTLRIMYSASGNFNDDWKNKNIYVSFNFH